MYYFFGAGNNCSGVLKFFGKDNVLAMVDNSAAKIGTFFEDIPIISFEEFLKVWNGETILITAFIKSSEIAKQLEEKGIYNYYICPYMQSGFFSCDKIIEVCNLLKYSSIAIYDKNPIAELLAKEIKKQKQDKCNIILLDDVMEHPKNNIKADLLLIIKEGFKDKGQFAGYENVLDLFEELEKNRNLQYGYLAKYKNIHYGERCFILGNGPSMKVNDLEKIYAANEISFASNRMFRIFDSTKWRPTYYVVGDSIVYRNNKDLLPKNVTCFIRDFNEKDSKSDNINWYSSNGEKYYPGYPQFSEDLVQGVFGGRMVTYDMFQIAAYMGFNEIYLLGIDFSWGEDGKNTHFYKSSDEDPVVKEAIKYRDEVIHAYISAKNYADSHGIKIYNATRGGYLEIFERVDFDKLFD